MNSPYVSKLIQKKIWQDFQAHFKSKTTAASYRADIDEIMNYFQKDFLEIDKDDAECYFSQMQRRVDAGYLKAGTMAKKFRELHSFAEYICDNRKMYHIGEEFCDCYYVHLKNVAKQEKHVGSIPVEHMDLLLKAAETDIMAYTILVLLYRVGLTSGEIASLKRDSFTAYDNGVYAAVAGRREPCFIPEDVFVILERYMSKTDAAEYLFVNSRGNPLNLMYISRMMKKYTQAAGLPPYSAESIRNTCGVNMFAYGAKPEQVAAQMGVTQMQIHRYKNLSYKENMLRAANHLVNVKILPPKNS